MKTDGKREGTSYEKIKRPKKKFILPNELKWPCNVYEPKAPPTHIHILSQFDGERNSTEPNDTQWKPKQSNKQ